MGQNHNRCGHCPKWCVSKVTTWKKQNKTKKNRGLGGGCVEVDRWRAGNEMETSRSMKRREEKVETTAASGQEQKENRRE